MSDELDDAAESSCLVYSKPGGNSRSAGIAEKIIKFD